MNLKGHINHVLSVDSFSSGRVWAKNKNGDASEKVQIKTETQALIGSRHDIHDESMTFARRFHPVEPHEGGLLQPVRPKLSSK